MKCRVKLGTALNRPIFMRIWRIHSHMPRQQLRQRPNCFHQNGLVCHFRSFFGIMKRFCFPKSAFSEIISNQINNSFKIEPIYFADIFESGSNNDGMCGEDSNDESNEYSDSRKYNDSRRPPLLFRGGFFRFLKRDGVSVRAECLNCTHGNVYSGHMWSSSNFIKHLSVSFSFQI